MNSSKLSANVPPFYPKSYLESQNKESSASTESNKNDSEKKIPEYITNCYPFVQEPENLNNTHWQAPFYPRHVSHGYLQYRYPVWSNTSSNAAAENNETAQQQPSKKKNKKKNKKKAKVPDDSLNINASNNNPPTPAISYSQVLKSDKPKPEDLPSTSKIENTQPSFENAGKSAKKRLNKKPENQLKSSSVVKSGNQNSEKTVIKNNSKPKNVVKRKSPSKDNNSFRVDIETSSKSTPVGKIEVDLQKDERVDSDTGCTVDQNAASTSSFNSNPWGASLSFSAVLKRTIQTTDLCEAHYKPKIPEKEEVASKSGKTAAPTKKSKKKKKKQEIPDSKNATSRKSKMPLTLDFSNLLTSFEKSSKKSTRETKTFKVSNVKVLAKKENIKMSYKTRNVLDSSAPVRMRGKEREGPRKKKLTPLKKVILQERAERKILRAKSESENKENADDVNHGLISDSSTVHATDVPSKPFYSDAKSMIHTRKFREYCDQFLDPDIDQIVTKLLQDLVRFQDRLHHNDPVKAKSKRRMVYGLREVKKHLSLGRIKCLIVAPNLEKSHKQGGLEDMLGNLMSLANDSQVPIVFALNRKSLGKICRKKVPISCIGIFNYEGTEENFKQLMNATTEARKSYFKLCQNLQSDLAQRINMPPENALCIEPISSSPDFQNDRITSNILEILQT